MNRFCIALITLLPICAAVDAAALEKPLRPAPLQSIPTRDGIVWSDWPGCRKAAMTGAAQAIGIWRTQAALRGVTINGPVASGGSVTGPALQPIMEPMIVAAGVPAAVAKGFAMPVSSAWGQWASSLRVPGLNWYPSFACFPGPVAPPTPNVPMPLITLQGNPEALSASRLKTAIRQALGATAQDPRAAAAIDGFAEDFALRFTRYLASAKVTNVMGGGAVPTFAPPHIPCGPVASGTATMQPGGFVGTWP